MELLILPVIIKMEREKAAPNMLRINDNDLILED